VQAFLLSEHAFIGCSHELPGILLPGEGPPSFVGQSFWARGFFVSTVGRDEAVIRHQEEQPLALRATFLGGPLNLVASATPSGASGGSQL
jgi:hypothetical protein